LLEAKTIKIMADTGYYLEIVSRDTRFDGGYFTYGVSTHVHLDNITAINTQTALGAIVLLFAALSIALIPTVIGAFLGAVITYILGIIDYDYSTMYGNDANVDKSFDMWFDANGFRQFAVYEYVETPNFGWLCTLAGVYIVTDKTHGTSSLGIYHTPEYGGGSRAIAR